MTPRISIVMPVKNGRDRVERALLSFKRQSWPNKELIVVDGMSSDGTDTIVARHADAVSLLIREADGSATEALNRGAAAATGDIVGFLMSDDWLEPDALFHIGSAFSADADLDVAAGGVRIVDEPVRQTDHGVAEEIIPGERLRLDLPTILGTPYCAAFYFSRKVWNELGGFSPAYRYGADRDFLMRCRLTGRKAVSMSPLVYAYCRHAGSDTLVEHEPVVVAFLEDHRRMSLEWLAQSPKADRTTIVRWRRNQLFDLAVRRLRGGQLGRMSSELIVDLARDPLALGTMIDRSIEQLRLSAARQRSRSHPIA